MEKRARDAPETRLILFLRLRSTAGRVTATPAGFSGARLLYSSNLSILNEDVYILGFASMLLVLCITYEGYVFLQCWDKVDDLD